MAKLLRIFISSPGDVVAERRRAALVIEKLAKSYARFFEIRPFLWETEPMLASGHFQDAILPPGETDILVLILWARLGTPLPREKYRGIDGRVPVTGTEWEFEVALAAHQQHGVPDILAYKKTAPPKAEYRTAIDAEELGRQLQQLEAFWSRHFVDKGEFRAAFGLFDDLDGFENKLENDLRRLIERQIAALSPNTDRAPSPTWLMGSPFRGLETYRFEHTPIFFGRSEATKTAVEHLVENAEAGRPFLLVLGASGAGKSSLAQAGIMPALSVRGVVSGVGEWRRAVVRPAGHPGGPFTALAAALADDGALPELLDGQDVSALARHLEAAAADPSFPIVLALAAREKAEREKGNLISFEKARLVLVVDQLEELFTLADLTTEQRKSFIICLKGLMDSGCVFVVATMRSDYWHRVVEVPLLVALAEGRGRLDLLPPTQPEITEMIRRPAEAARLSFEIDARSEIKLDAALADEAAREPGALPLLSFLLDALYVKDIQEGKSSTLRHVSMRALGGLKGAIATRAEAVFAALPADAKAAFPKVMRTLVTVSRSSATPTARVVSIGRFADGSPERRVVNAFLDPNVRLLVADGDREGSVCRLAHEALITHWERAKRQIAQDREDLRTRTMVEEALAEWHEADKINKRGYLLRDPLLANALDLTGRWPGELDADSSIFVKISHQRNTLRRRLTISAIAVFAILAISASVLGVLFRQESQRTASAQQLRPSEQIEAFKKYYESELPDTSEDVRRNHRRSAIDGWRILAAEDLNDDSLLDFIVINNSQWTCNTGGCQTNIYITKTLGKNYVNVLDLSMHLDNRASRNTTNGYRDIVASESWQSIDGKPVRSVFRWDGAAYRLSHYMFDGGAPLEYAESHLLDENFMIDPIDEKSATSRNTRIKSLDLFFSGTDFLGYPVQGPEQGQVIGKVRNKDWYLVYQYKRPSAFTPACNLEFELDSAKNPESDGSNACIKKFSLAIEQDPKADWAFFRRGEAYFASKDYDRAIADYAQATLIRPSFLLYYKLGSAYLAKDQYDKAIVNFGEAIHLDPDHDWVVYNDRGVAFAHQKDYESAIADYTKAIQIFPSPMVFHNRCEAHAILALDLAQALRDCNESLRLRPNHADTLNTRGLVFFKLAEFASAITDYSLALSRNIKDASSLYGRGMAKLRSGDTAGGSADILAAETIQPDIAKVYAGYGVKL